MNEILATKLGMQAFFDNSGKAFPVTLVSLKGAKPEELIKEGDKLTIWGISKGKGFAGVVKRHGFKGGPRTHGQSDRERSPGSIGSTTTPGRVMKGKRMAGRMGNQRVTLKNLLVAKVDGEILYIKGAIPGIKKGRVRIKIKTVADKKNEK